MDKTHPLYGKVEILGQTWTSVVYCVPSETTVLKTPELWVDGKRHDKRPNKGFFEKEDKIYKILGDHPRIVKSLGLEQVAPGVTALRLERATFGSVRDYIMGH